jgi:DNA repair protein RadD
MLFVQMIGRGLRTAEGKKDCLILDHSDTHLRLGFVTDIHHEKLDDGKKKETSATERKEPLPKECGKCGILKPAKVHKCPACGFKPEMQSQIEHVEGDLAEMSSSERRKAKLNRETSLDSKEQFLGELVSYAKEHGYKSGWAANQYREKFGVWPNRVQPADVGIIGFATQDWIRSKQIRYAKSKAKQAQVAA